MAHQIHIFFNYLNVANTIKIFHSDLIGCVVFKFLKEHQLTEPKEASFSKYCYISEEVVFVRRI